MILKVTICKQHRTHVEFIAEKRLYIIDTQFSLRSKDIDNLMQTYANVAALKHYRHC